MKNKTILRVLNELNFDYINKGLLPNCKKIFDIQSGLKQHIKIL